MSTVSREHKPRVAYSCEGSTPSQPHFQLELGSEACRGVVTGPFPEGCSFIRGNRTWIDCYCSVLFC